MGAPLLALLRARAAAAVDCAPVMRFTSREKAQRVGFVTPLLSFVLAGSACHPAPPEAAIGPEITVGRADAPPVASATAAPDAVLPAAAFHLASDGVVPSECFAWSPRISSAACTLGLVFTMGMDTSPEWRVAFLGDARAQPVDLVTEAPPGRTRFSTTEPPAPSARAELEAALAAGGYVTLAPLRRRLREGTPLAWAAGAELRWTRKRTSPGGENMAPRYTDTLAIRWAPGEALATIESREDQPVASPEYAVYLIPGERFAVVSDIAHYGDEGTYGVRASAWRCDRVARRCE